MYGITIFQWNAMGYQSKQNIQRKMQALMYLILNAQIIHIIPSTETSLAKARATENALEKSNHTSNWNC